MKWIITFNTKEYTDRDGNVHKSTAKSFELPFTSHQTVYYVFYQCRLFGKDRWVVRRSKIVGMWATNTYGVQLDNGEHIDADMFHKLFTDKESAIEFCLKKNNHLKVKVYN